MKNNKNSLVVIIIIAFVFGMIGGIGGEIVARMYLLQDAYNVPLFGEINVPQNVYGGSNLIIESPKKVIVEQNTKVLETVNSVRKNIVGIFDKIAVDEKTKNNQVDVATSSFDLEDYYNLSEPKGQGFVVTSDGWVMSNHIPANLLVMKKTKATSTLEKLKADFIDSYIIVTSEGQIYNLIDVELDSSQSISFWRIDANDLGVRQFEDISNIDKGQLVVATNFEGMTWLSTVSDKYAQELPLVFSSDKTYSEISLVHDLSEDFEAGFLFDTNGDLIALLNSGKAIVPVSSYFSCLSCLLNNELISRPYLGINYVNLDDFSSPTTSKPLGHGAMIYANASGVAIIKNSPAEIAGLKEGDIITAINTIKIDDNNTLSDLISSFKPGEKLNFTIERNSREMQIIVSLSDLK